MKRTNIYLEERQARALDELASAQGITRAEAVRRLIDVALAHDNASDVTADIAIIERSFGTLKDHDDCLSRGEDDRSRHLDRMWRL